MTLGIVVPSLGRRPDELRRCVRAAVAAAGPGRVLVATPSPGPVEQLLQGVAGVVVQDDGGAPLPEAINTGVAALPHECHVVTWIGDDDWHLPAPTREHARSLVDEGAVMVYAPAVVVWQPSGRRRVVVPGRRAIRHLLAGVNLVRQPSCSYSRAAWQEVGGVDATLALAFDCDLHLRLAEVGPVLSAKRTSAVEVEHVDRLSTTSGEASRAELREVAAAAAARAGVRRPVRVLSRARQTWAWHDPRGPRRATSELADEQGGS